ncbi:glutathione S-transferase family protein [Streptomyces sp. NPDC093018]|uniref:glutathione S-transferase family protein n=1 Tax=Streptomyces sp. NPDC093018 TaxID=3155067 RepID=UPI003417F3DD
MSLVLLTGDRHFSSWSMRGRIILAEKCLDFDELVIELDWPMEYEPSMSYREAGGGCSAPAERIRRIEHTGRWDASLAGRLSRVPTLIDDRTGAVASDAIAIAEYLEEEYQNSPRLLGGQTRVRTDIRNFALHVHADLGPLLHDASYAKSLRTRLPGEPSRHSREQAEWIAENVAWCLEESSGLFLFGDFSLADAMLAPIVQQITRWELVAEPLPRRVREYFDRILTRPSVARHLDEARQPYREIASHPPGSPAWIAAHYRVHENATIINNWQTDMYHELSNQSARTIFSLARQGVGQDEIASSYSKLSGIPREVALEQIADLFSSLHPSNVFDTAIDFSESPF